MKHQTKQNIKRGIKSIMPGVKNLILRNTSEALKPKQIWFEVTDACNCRCKFCNIWQKKPTENILTIEEIKKIFDNPFFNELEEVMLSGGEPVLRPDIKELILTIHQALPKIKIFLSTNGLLAERVIEVVKFAMAHYINFGVGVSLDALGGKHDSIRGVGGLFKKIDWLLNELLKLKKSYDDKFNLVVGSVLIDSTLPSLEEIKKYTKKLDISWGVQWYNESSYYNNVGKNLLTHNKFLIETIKSLEPSITNELGLRLIKGKSIRFPCFSMYTFCLLKCNGDVVPCFNLWDFKVGNLRESSPVLIWHGAKAKTARKIIKNCQGCLNGCGVSWSLRSCILPALPFYIKRELGLLK